MVADRREQELPMVVALPPTITAFWIVNSESANVTGANNTPAKNAAQATPATMQRLICKCFTAPLFRAITPIE
jgi:hypothetical protein